MCENPIDQQEGACLECDHDEDGKSPGKFLHKITELTGKTEIHRFLIESY